MDFKVNMKCSIQNLQTQILQDTIFSKFNFVPIDKLMLIIVLVCKSHYIYCLIILDNHMSVLCSYRISTKDEKLDLPSRSSVLSNNVILIGLETTLLQIKRSSDNQIRPNKMHSVFPSCPLSFLSTSQL